MVYVVLLLSVFSSDSVCLVIVSLHTFGYYIVTWGCGGSELSALRTLTGRHHFVTCKAKMTFFVDVCPSVESGLSVNRNPRL